MKEVGSNPIKCILCHTWIHERCSAITGKQQNV